MNGKVDAPNGGTTTTGTCSTFSPENAKSIEIYNEAVNDLVKVSTTLGFILNNLSHKSHIHHLSLVDDHFRVTLKVIIDPYPIFRATLTYIIMDPP